MTKQEKYEKKMAKYFANKARKAELEKRVKELAIKQNGFIADVEYTPNFGFRLLQVPFSNAYVEDGVLYLNTQDVRE